MKSLLKKEDILNGWIKGGHDYDVRKEWMEKHVGTIHKAQGREAEAVFLILGVVSEGARIWASKQPNILNVAMTRAKEVVYVVGNADRWTQYHFGTVHHHINVRRPQDET